MVRGECSSIHRNPDRTQDSSLDLYEQYGGERPAERGLAQKALRKGRDLFAFQHRIPTYPSRPLPETHVGRGHPERGAHGDHEDVVRQAVPGANLGHESGAPLLAGFTWNDDPVETPAQRVGVHVQVSPRTRGARPAQSESSARSALLREE